MNGGKTMQRLNDSHRLLAAGRQVQRRLDCRLLEARIRELNDKARAEGDPDVVLIIDELKSLRNQITEEKS